MQPRFYRFRELGSFQCSLEHSLAHHYRQLALFPGKKPLNFLYIKMDNFYGPLSVRITGFDCKYNETYDTIFELGKIGGRNGLYKKGKGSPAMFPQP